MSHNTLPLGSVTIRTRHKRGGEKRAWVKVAEPNTWKLRAVVVWESINGPVPRGMVIHHKDENKLNDSIDNLSMMTKGEHLAEHHPDYKDRAIASFVAARRRLRWSTKSETKRTGRPAAYDPAAMTAAIADYVSGGGSFREVADRHGVGFSGLSKQVSRLRQVGQQ